MIKAILGDIVNVEISGEFREIPEFNREAIADQVSSMLNKYTNTEDISYINVYIKRFEAINMGKPLIFCNVTINTAFGIVSEHGSAWGVKQALNQAMKNCLVNIEKTAEEHLMGEYSQPEIFA